MINSITRSFNGANYSISSSHSCGHIAYDADDVMYYISTHKEFKMWIEQLSQLLHQYNIPYQLCEKIGCSRARDIFKKVAVRPYNMRKAFYDLTPESARNVFKAYIRHTYTNYDDYCQEHSSEISNLTKQELHHQWSVDCPEDYAKYIKMTGILYPNKRMPANTPYIYNRTMSSQNKNNDCPASTTGTSIVSKEEKSSVISTVKSDTPVVKTPCATTIWRRNLSPERRKELNDRRREKSVVQFAILTQRYKDMTPEEKREYNHQRYLRNKEAYKKRSREQYARMKAESNVA